MLILATLTFPAIAAGLPTGGQVEAGQANIAQQNPQSMLITQGSDKAVINWNGFSIGQGNTVQINNGKGATLNRVTGNQLSSINGQLSSTGSVYLINPKGVVVGKSGVVNVGGSFVASTLDVDNANFLRGGDMHFSKGTDASVANLGKIGALGGDVALMAGTVRNEGTISAPKGTTGLIAGSDILMRDAATNGGKFVVKVGGAGTSATNTGAINAAAAELRAEGGNVYALAGNTAGVIRATGVTARDGHIYLTAGKEGSVTIAGSTLAATKVSGDGGTVDVTGKNINVASNARIDVSAKSTGGKGGRAKLIADMSTGTLNFHGTALAKGGATSGDGGFVETSGAYVNFNGARIDTSSKGLTGTWLTDPYDLTIDATAAGTINTNLATTNVTLQTTSSGTSGPGNANAAGNGDIFVNSALNWSTGNTLTLDAYRNININSAITASGGGKVVLVTGDTAGTGKSASATGDYSFGLTGTTFAGSLNFTGGSASGSTLNIGTGGDNIAPTSYTLLYALSTPLNTGGKYALATNIADSVARTTAVYVSSNNIIYTGLGHTVSGLNISSTAAGAYGLFGTVAGATPIIRDIGVSGTVTGTNSEQAGGLIGTIGTSTIKNTFSTVNVTGNGAGTGIVTGAGGLIGSVTNTSNISNSTASGTVKGQNNVGGLLGTLNGTGGSITNSSATGVITSNGQIIGGLVGLLAGTETVSNSYATGSVTGTGTGTASAGGLIGQATGTQTLSGSYATGAVSAQGSGVGGLVGVTATNVTINSSYATGNATSAQSQVGGLVGTASSTLTVNNSYATGNAKATGAASANIGGLIGSASTLVVNTSFATGSATGFSTVGGLVGSVGTSGTLKDVYSQGNVSATSTAATQGAGGLIAYAVNTTVTNAYSSGTLSGPAGGTGAVLGRNGGTFTGTNVYWDSTKDTSTAIGAGGGTLNFNPTGPSTGAVSSSTLTNGTLPGGFNTTVGGTDINGTPWHTGNGLYPYFLLPGYVPANSQSISGYAFGSNGVTPSGSANITIYFNGGVLGSGITADANTGFYTTYVGANTISANSKLAGTMGLSTSPTVVAGATYTDTPTLLSNNVINFNFLQNLFGISTTEATSTALATSLASTFTTGTYNTLSTATLNTANWIIRAANAFSINSGISHAGAITLQSGGNLSIVPGGSVTSTASNITLAANGAFTNTGGATDVSAAGQWLIYSQAANQPTNLPTFAVTGGLTGKSYYGDAYNFTTGTFASTPNSGNRFVYGYQPTLTVTPDTKNVTYNGAVQSNTYTLAGYINGVDQSADTLSGSATGGASSSKNAGTYGGLAASGNLSSDENYAIVYGTGGALTITPAALTLSTGNVSKTYDGGTGVVGGSAIVTGGTLFGGDTLGGGSFAYTNKNAGVGNKVVTLSGVTVNDGNSGGNYAVSYANNTTSTINPAGLTISGIGANNKIYDGSTVATLNTSGITYTGLVGGDNVTVSATGAFIDKNVGSSKTVTLSSIYGGNDLGNYTITGQASAAANITSAALTVTANNDARFVTLSDSAGYNGVNYSGFVGGDTPSALNTSGLTVVRPNAGTDVTAGTYVGALVASGVASTNYTITYANGNYTIVPANNALVKVANTSTAYGSTPNYMPASVQYLDGSNNAISNLTLLNSNNNSFTYSDGAGGTLAFVLNPTSPTLSSAGFTSVGNYNISAVNPSIGGGNLVGQVYFTGNLAVMAKAVSASASGVSKVYDGTTDMTGVTLGLNGQVSGDILTVNGSGAFSQKNVGTNLGYNISGLSLSGMDSGNYYLSGGSSFTGNDGAITQASLTIGGITAGNKVYDGTTVATVNTGGISYGGLVTGDTVAITGSTGAFDNRNAGTGKTVTLTNTFGGADIGNYLITDQTTTAANISQAQLTLGAVSDNKTYDGTTASNGVVGVTGLVGGDTVSGTTQAFDSKNAGSRTLSVNGYTINDGNGGNNYAVTTAGASGSISQAQLTLGAVSDSKTYNGTNVSNGIVSVSGLVGGDTVSSAVQTFDSKNAGNRTLSVGGGYTVNDGNGGDNYAVTTQTATGTILQANLYVGGTITADNKVYDGTTTAVVDGSGASYTGLFTGDSVAVAANGVFDSKNVGTGKTVTLNYTGADAGNYAITDLNSVTANISQALLTLGAVTDSKTYDGTAASNGMVDVTGLVGGDTVSGAVQSFDSKNAGNRTLSVNGGYLVNDGNGGNNYAITTQTAAGTISQASLNVGGTITADNKVYDGTTAANVNAGGATYTGLVSGDSITVGGAFGDKNVGTGKTVTLNYGGADAGNYLISGLNSVTANISQALLTLGAVSDSKTYNGTTASSGIVDITGLVGGDTVSGAVQSFDSKNAGNRTLSVNDGYLVNDGNGGNNYAITTQTAAGSISQASLNVGGTITADNKVYDGTTAANVNAGGATYTGLVSGDSITVGGTFGDKNVGTGKTVTLNYGGADAGNYLISGLNSVTANISQAQLTLGAVSDSKTYNGTTVSSGIVDITGLVGGDTVSGVTQAFDSKNAGNRTLNVNGYTLNDGNGGNNYAITTQTAAGSISQASLNVGGTITADNKVYDGTTAANVNAGGATYTGLIGGDSITVGGAFGDKNVGTGKTVTLNYGGADAGNYLISGLNSVTANISQALLTLGAVSDSKTYDGTAASNGMVDVTGLVGGDTVSGAVQSFDSKNAGNRTLSVNGGYLVNDGNGGNNYAITTQTAAGTIGQASLNVGGTITADNKVYDGTTAANVNAGGATYTGLVSGDSITVGGAFGDKNVGTGKAVTLNYGGADAGNYAITGLTTTMANISQAQLTLGAVSDSKTYNGTTASSGIVDITGLVGGDTVSGATQAFDSKNAGNRTLSVNGYTLNDGNGGNNYAITTQTAAGSISQASLNVGGTITADNKVYDGTTAANVNAGGATYTGLIGGDSVAINANGTFDSKNVGIGKTVALSFTGADAGNYAITGLSSTTANISQAQLTLGAVSDSKTYNGTTVSSGIVDITGLVGGDTVSGATQAFDSKNAGNRTLSVNGYTLNDGNGGNNYAVTTQTAAGTIDRAQLIASLQGTAQKTYDGTTFAKLTSANFMLSGVIAGDVAALNDPTSGSYDNSNAGVGKLVRVSGLALDGADAGNYFVNNFAVASIGIITPAGTAVTPPTSKPPVTTPRTPVDLMTIAQIKKTAYTAVPPLLNASALEQTSSSSSNSNADSGANTDNSVCTNQNEQVTQPDIRPEAGQCIYPANRHISSHVTLIGQ